MAKVAITEQYLEDIADAIRTKTGLSDDYYPSEMATAILSISGGGGIVPTGTINISSNGTHNVTQYASAAVSVPNSYTSSDEGKVVSSGALVSQTSATYTSNNTYDTTTINSVTVNVGSTINNQDKTVNPSTSQQSIIADSGYSGLGTVTINAMPTGSATAPASISGSSASVSTGTNTLTLSKTVSVTPTVSAGYVSSGTAGNSSVSLTASVTTKGAATITPTTTNQTISSGTYLTGTQTIAGDADLIAGNIKKNVQIFGVTGTYEGSGGTPTIDSLTVTPTESEQTFNSSSVDGYKPVTVSAIASDYVGSSVTRRGSSDLEVNGAVVAVPPGYYSNYAGTQVASGSATGPSSVSSTGATISTSTNTITLTKTNVTTTPTVSAGYVSSATASTGTVTLSATATINPTPTASGATVTIPAGYYTTQTTKSVTSGSATGPSSITQSSATVSTGTNTITLTKTNVSTTPTVSAGYVASATSSTATVALTASVTTKAAATITPGTTNQTIASGTYLTGTQTISGDANLIAGNIKKNTSIFGVTGTYEGSGGGSALTVDTATATLSSAAASISFTGLAGEPTSFAVVSAANLATGASPWKTAAVVFDGTSLHGQTIRNTSNAQVTYDSADFSKTYSNGTLTITGSGTNFQANQYKLVYTYGGSDIGTADVQVGSGATSITFTGLEEEPSYFSCIFKSNFSTSSGYQRVIVVVYDGTSTYGMEMDSSAKYSDAHWTYSYNNGSLTITSSGTNAGGYFHQPGYYQLTYAVEGSSGNYQTKSVTYYATNSQQTAAVAADSGYDALKKVNVTIPAVTTTNLTASNIVSGVTIQVGDSADSDRIASVTGNVVLQHYYTGSSAPSSATGSNGDLYLQS